MNTLSATIPHGADAAAPAPDGLPALLAEIRARRAEFITTQQIPRDVVDGFKRICVYRAMVAKRLGGEARTPSEFCRLIEMISEADGSAGWGPSLGSAARYLSTL